MMPKTEILSVIQKSFDKRIKEPDRPRISYIIKTIETRQFSPRVFSMVYNYICSILDAEDYEHRIRSFEEFFEDLLTDAFPKDSREYHLRKLRELN